MADRVLSARRYFQIRKLCLRASITRPCWHMEKRKEPLILNWFQTCIIWMHNSRCSQDGPDWASRPVPADVATHVPTHCIAPLQEPDCCPMKSRAVDETSTAWSVILSWWLRFWRIAELGGVVAAKKKTKRMKITTTTTALNSAPHYFSENLFSDTGDNR